MQSTRVTTVLGLVMCCIFAKSAISQTGIKFDKFKNLTYFDTPNTETGQVTYGGGKQLTLVRDMKVGVGFSCQGDTSVGTCSPDSVELLFIANTRNWVGRQGDLVTLLLDGKPEDLGKAEWDGKELDAHDLIEFFDLHIPPQLLISKRTPSPS